MHIAERLLNTCYFLEKKIRKTAKKKQKGKKMYKKYFKKLTFQMQRCRLRLTALTLQNTRYHSINTRDKKKKQTPKTAKD